MFWYVVCTLIICLSVLAFTYQPAKGSNYLTLLLKRNNMLFKNTYFFKQTLLFYYELMDVCLSSEVIKNVKAMKCSLVPCNIWV
jgi:hypothetical protein